MKSIHLTSTLCAAIVALHGIAFAGGEGWSSDFEAAKKLAAESKKDLLLDFTGSDWCGWCIKLNKEVFSLDPFKEGVKDKFVLVEVDFPKDDSKLSEETKTQNKELGEKYAVQGYPSIILCDAEGRPYATTGYKEGGPVKYVAQLNEMRGNKAKRDEALATAAKAEGVAKAKALIAALNAMKLDEKVVSNFYGDIADQIKAADPKDESGFGKKAAAKKRMADFQEDLQVFATNKDMDGALALVEKALKEGGFQPEETVEIMMTRAVILAMQNKVDDAIKAVDETKKFAPESPQMANINNFRKKLVEAKNKPADAPAKDEAKPAKEADKPADK